MSKPRSTEDSLISNIVDGIENVKGLDVSILDIRDIENTVCRYLVVCTGSSNTHVSAIVSAIKKTVSKELKEKPFQTEGNENAEWVLIDYINVVVHVFQNKSENITILKNSGVMLKPQKLHQIIN